MSKRCSIDGGMWKPTTKWGPPRRTGSAPIAVEKVDSPDTLGLAKQRGAINEKLASDLAALAGVRVPRVEFDEIQGLEAQGHYTVSHVHGVESTDLTAVQQLAPDLFKKPEVQDAIAKASGLLPFYAWTGAADQQKDDHLVLDREADGQYHVSGVDFESTFTWGIGDGGPINPPGVPPALIPKVDSDRVASTVAAIEAITNEQIHTAVAALPASVSEAEKRRLEDGLIGRRAPRLNHRQWNGLSETREACPCYQPQRESFYPARCRWS
jgi:hypothetical protein